MAETLEQAFWVAVTAWFWIVLAVMALGPVVAIGMIRLHNETMRRIGQQGKEEMK